MKTSNYIDEYQNHSGVTAALNADTLRRPYVAYLSDTGKIDWNTKEPDYASMPLTYEFLSDGEFEFYKRTAGNMSIDYKRINGKYASDEWKTLSSSDNPRYRLNVEAGDIIQFGGHADDYTDTYFRVSSGVTYNVYGNVMSLFDKFNFSGMTSFPSTSTNRCLLPWMFDVDSLYASETALLDARNLVFPVLDLSNNSIFNIFGNCVNMKYGPKILPATIVSNTKGSYQALFTGCESLVEAPELSFTSMTSGNNAYETQACYRMFSYCTSLTKSPILKAEELKSGCYKQMFSHCTNLNYVTCLAKTGTDGSNTENWLLNVSPTGTFVKHPDAVWPTGPSGIPEGWTVIDADV